MNNLSPINTEGLVRRGSILPSAIYFCMVISVIGLIFSIAVSSIAMAIAVVLFVCHVSISGISVFPRTRLDLYFMLYIIAELLASVFSLEPLASFYNMKRLFLISFVYFVLLSIDDDSKLKTAMILLIGVTSLLSLIELFSLTSVGGHYMRISQFQHYMTEGGIKMIILLLLLPFIIHAHTPRLWRILAIISSVPILIGLILTQTRSSWLGFIAGVVTIGVMKSKKVIIVLVLFIVLFVVFAPSDFRNRSSSIFDLQNSSNLSRIHMIVTGWKMFLDNPVLGVGDIDLKKIYITYIEPLEEGEGGHLHNNFMTLLVTIGIVGFAATFALFVKILLLEIESTRLTSGHWLYNSVSLGSLAVYAGFHVNGLFEWNFGDHEIAVLLWFTVGLSFVAQKFSSMLNNTNRIERAGP